MHKPCFQDTSLISVTLHAPVPQSPAPPPYKRRAGEVTPRPLPLRALAPYQSNFMPNRAMVGGTIRLGSSKAEPTFQVMF